MKVCDFEAAAEQHFDEAEHIVMPKILLTEIYNVEDLKLAPYFNLESLEQTGNYTVILLTRRGKPMAALWGDVENIHDVYHESSYSDEGYDAVGQFASSIAPILGKNE